jgi:LmbE family N-acetylglucosaminyl deacetylase
MIIPTFTAGSRLMLIAPHPDDEALACSITLQQAVRAGAAIRVVYATDGDDNPWPQRVLERKWRLNATDRQRWGKLRRAEALAALRVMGVKASDARFLALPDQQLTGLLMSDCRGTLKRFAAIIADWVPTHLLVPSIADTHPDHSALAVMLRLVLTESFSLEPPFLIWSYVVHGKSRAFLDRALQVRQSEPEAATKLRAIRCHKTQLKLSRRRFLGYAARPERLVKLRTREAIAADGSISAISRQLDSLRIKLRLSSKAMRPAEPGLFILGRDGAGALRCLRIQIPIRSSRVEAFDSATLESIAMGRYRGNSFAGEITIPIDIFLPTHPVFVKLERRSWFFDEAGWLEVPTAAVLKQNVRSAEDVLEDPSLAIR